jgi:hypothetical protein
MTTPAKKAPSAKETPKGQDRKREQFARAGTRHVHQHPWNDPRADYHRQGSKSAHLYQRNHKAQQDRLVGTGVVRAAAEKLGEGRQQHQGHHHREILDDQPADGHAPIGGIDEVAFLECLQQDHGTGDRQAEPEHQALADAPAPGSRHAHAKQCRKDDLADRARDGDAAHGQQVGSGEMQPDAEHQQDDAHFGQLSRQRRIRHMARGEGAGENAGDQVADQRRQAEAVGEIAEHRSEHEAYRHGRDQRDVVVHLHSSAAAVP